MEITKIPNGVILEPNKPSDYFAGVNSPIGFIENNPSGDWADFLPTTERQKIRNGDTYACVTFSALNSLETQFNYLIASKKINLEAIGFLNNNGYIDELGKVNFDDSYTAKMSGTAPGQGNSLFNVANSIRHDGILPQKKYTVMPTVEEFYAEIPQAEKDKAKEIYKYFDFSYEWVFENFSQHLKQAPLQIATGVCPGWDTNDIIQKCDLPVAHATMIYKIDSSATYDFDSYDPFQIRLAPNYNLPYVLKLLINPINNKTMQYVIVGKEQYLLHDTLKVAFNIGDELELGLLKDKGLSGSPIPMANLDGYLIYPLVNKDRLRDLFGFNA